MIRPAGFANPMSRSAAEISEFPDWGMSENMAKNADRAASETPSMDHRSQAYPIIVHVMTAKVSHM